MQRPCVQFGSDRRLRRAHHCLTHRILTASPTAFAAHEKTQTHLEVPIGTSDAPRTSGNAGTPTALTPPPTEVNKSQSLLSRFGCLGCSLLGVIVNVTTLGSGSGGAARSVGNIVNYLEGSERPQDRRLDAAGSAAQSLDAAEMAGPGRYYADSGDGRWLGNGASGKGFALEGFVERDQIEKLLLGADPNTGERLMHNSGVSQRANTADASRDADLHSVMHNKTAGHGVSNPNHSPTQTSDASRDASRDASPNHLQGPEGTIGATQFAAENGIDRSYISRTIRNTNTAIEAQEQAQAEGLPVPELPATHLKATKHGKAWFIDLDEAQRFIDARKPQQIIHGYDITFSVPKSVSVLWAASTPQVQDTISDSLTRAVESGMAYIEDEAFWVRAGRGSDHASGMTAAAYRHTTSRALEPQLHDHVVVANMATTNGGQVRAVDARGLMAHATTAGHVAAATLRRELTQHLGVEWTTVHKGIGEIDGVPLEAIKAMSSRREAVIDLAEEVGAFTTQGRQTAALMTRPDKAQGVNEQALVTGWRNTLAEHGLTAEHAATLTPGPRPLSTSLEAAREDQLMNVMSGRQGVAQFDAVFDRRTVVEYVADRVGGHIADDEVTRLADRWLAERAVPLEISNTWETIGHKGKVALSHDTVYSTPEIIRAERSVIDRHAAGLHQGNIRLATPVVEAAIDRLETALGSELGPDQAAAVRAITQDGHQFQAVQGLAGAGKTTAMTAAVEAWHTAGIKVIGSAPFGAAARKLGDEIDTKTRTVESLLVNIGNNGAERVLDANTVVLIDESSTISTHQLATLYHAASDTGASIITVGDPQQHRSVEAGGLWSALVELHSDTTPVLDVNRRQNPETLRVVREALATYRTGEVGQALDVLEDDGRIETADTWPELLDRLADDWLTHHTSAVDAGRAPSQMIAERNRDREALNTRAQALLTEAGRLGPGFQIGDATFHIGDRIVAQQLSYDITEPGNKARHLVNGSTGRVIGFDGPPRQPDLVVDFDDIGRVTVPHDFVAEPIGPGRGGGLSPAYAVTSYKAEGQTYDAALGLAAPGAVNKEGMYVTLTRGRDDLAIYSIDPNQTPGRVDAEIPTPADQRTMTAALRDTLERTERPPVASIADAGIAAALDELSPTNRTQAIAEARIAGTAITQPDPIQLAVLGPRPPRRSEHQHTWDQAVATQAIYQHRYDTSGRTITSVPQPSSAPALNPAHERDHRAMEIATTQARRAAVASMPLDDLLAERAMYRDDSGSFVLERLTNTVTQAEHALTLAQRSVDRLTPLANTRSLRRAPEPGAQLRLEEATEQRDLATAKLTVAQGDLAQYRTNGQPGAARGQLIDDALTWRINTATKEPANYLTNVLGPRPEGANPARNEWNRAAHLIERVRHNNGLTPNHGPQPGETPLQRAAGTPNANWKPLTTAINHLTKARSAENTRDQGIQR